MSEKRVRRSKEQIIADLEAQIAKLKTNQPAKESQVELTRESAGIPELLAAFDAAATQNSIKSGELIKALARFKRARVKITSSNKGK